MRIFLLFVTLIAVFILLLFLITSKIISDDVKRQCNIAEKKYRFDCIASLITLVDDKNNDFRLRNSAIWALGQLGDKASLTVLKKYYTGNISEKEPLDKVISQYELKKAINLVNGGFNLNRFVKF